MQPKVFSDLHHFGLFNSLRLLFENRLGGKIYRPIGEDWLEKGYWKMAEIYFNHPSTVAQYLGIKDGNRLKNNHYEIYEPEHTYWQKALTPEQFFAKDIDIVIASIPEHIESFKRLCREHPNHPKFIYQIGNAWPVEAGTAPNIMASAKIAGVPENIHFIEYHQEFDLDIFYYSSPPIHEKHGDLEVTCLCLPIEKNIYSFINCLNTADIYKNDWPLFTQLESLMPDWKWRTFGGSCRDGVANGEEGVAEKMREAKFIWHVKAGGDGYGHVLYNSAAVGRPAIVKKSYYAGKMGEELMRDGETCLDIEGLDVADIVRKIEFFSEPNHYAELCQNVYKNFKEKVDFDKEAEKIKSFIDNLV